jgi:hypothetical protein
MYDRFSQLAAFLHTITTMYPTAHLFMYPGTPHQASSSFLFNNKFGRAVAVVQCVDCSLVESLLSYARDSGRSSRDISRSLPALPHVCNSLTYTNDKARGYFLFNNYIQYSSDTSVLVESPLKPYCYCINQFITNLIRIKLYKRRYLQV